MLLSRKQKDFLVMTTEFQVYAVSIGVEMTYGEAFRTSDQQALHLKNGHSRVKRSMHQDRLAMDYNFFIDGKYVGDPNANPRHKKLIMKLGEHWERLGGRWGGRFGVTPANYAIKIGWDAGHFEWKAH